MLRVLVWSVLALTVLFAGSIVAIRAQPYDDRELREFLFESPGCEGVEADSVTNRTFPCFHSIVPSHTSREDAVALLEANDGIENIYNGAMTSASWTVNPDSPQYPSVVGKSGELNFGGSSVVTVVVRTDFQLGDFWILWDKPNKVRLTGYNDWLVYTFRPYQTRILVQVRHDCDDMHTLWQKPVNLLLINIPVQYIHQMPETAIPIVETQSILTELGCE